jgi:serine phosphatase RsbU (regulator of sigma subunit)
LVRHHPEQFCTAVFVALQPTESGIRFTAASGGHHLPIRRRPGGTFETIGHTGTILGMLDAPGLTDASTLLAPGDVVVLYTDGVTEARYQGEFFDDERLLAAIEAAAGGDAQQIADAIVAAALGFQHGDARDDIAVVVIRVPSTQT